MKTEALSKSESAILVLLAEGLGNKGISARIGLSDKTVKNHLCRIFQKFGVQSRSGAVAYAFRHGLVA